MKKYYLFGTQADYIKVMWKDILSRENVQYATWHNENYANSSQWEKKLRHFQFHHKLFHKYTHSLKSVWRFYYSEVFETINPKEENIIIFCDAIPIIYDTGFTQILKEKYNAKLILILINTCYSMYKTYNAKYVKSILNKLGMDYIYTFDIEDANRYDLLFNPNMYSKVDNINIKSKEDYDCFFVGNNKGRLDGLIDLQKNLKVMD